MRLRYHTGSGRLLTAIGHGFALSALALACGCDTKGFIDPSEMGRFNKDPLIMPIVSTVDPSVEEVDNQWSIATEPTAEDAKAVVGDYHISPNDLLAITLSDLNGPNTESIKQSRVTESGNVSLPFLKESVRAKGLTEIQLERAIVDAYKQAQLIENANVSVTVIEARGRTFDIGGAVQAPQIYPILASDFRLFNALVMAHGVTSPFITNIYIIRQPEDAPGAADTTPAPTRRSTTNPTSGPSSDELAPHVRAGDGSLPVATATPTANRPLQLATNVESGDGQSFGGFRESNPGQSQRVIRIPYQGFERGELKYNIAIRPHDVIYVQPPQQGFYFVGGHVARGGSFQLVGQKVTLTDAIIAAGMLDGLAIPQRTDIIRHVDPDHEVFARVDLARIFGAEAPDIYLKPGDKIMVGTNAIAPFLAAIRGGFRITYGFGFLFDRNYAYPTRFGAL
ncbi:MAG TPA: polysaccharide biosynthesis/export family protein [Tepidisphaeraceae bacterium]